MMKGFQIRKLPGFSSLDNFFGPLTDVHLAKVSGDYDGTSRKATPSHAGESNGFQEANEDGSGLGNRYGYSPLMKSTLTGRRPVGEYRK